MGENIAKGFGGLSFYITDVDAAIAEADQIASSPRSATSQPSSTLSVPIEPIHQDGGAAASGLKKLVGWVFAIGIIFVVKAYVFSGIHSLSSSGTSPTYPYDAAKPSDDSSSNVSGVAGGDAAADYNIAVTNDTAAAVPAITVTAAPEITTQANVGNDDASVMSKPEPGEATLTMPELRYCRAEEIRISAQITQMDAQQGEDTAKNIRNTNNFNDVVSSYNSVCLHRSVISSSEIVARSQVEEQRSALQAEGRSRVY